MCVYLDGLSGHFHGAPATASKDREIRTWLRNHGYDVIEIAVSDLGDQDAMARHFRRLAGHLREDGIRERVKSDAKWFHRAEGPEGEPKQPHLRLLSPDERRPYENCVPLVPLEAAAGLFSDPQMIEDGDWDWVEVGASRRLQPGMFIAKVVGHSMEPKIPDGSYCLFRKELGGTREGKIVLVHLQDVADPETDKKYTVKRYESEKTSDEDTWRHVQITLRPLNPDYDPIVLTPEDEAEVHVIAELVEVVG